MERVAKGLAGVIVDDTSISDIDGEAGRLRYRGYAIEALVQLPFETVVALLLQGELPDADGAAGFARRLHDATRLPPALAQTVLAIAATASHPMLALQSITPLLASDAQAPRGDGDTDPPCAALPDGFTLAARLPAALALVLRGREALRDTTEGELAAGAASYGELLLQLLTGRTPTQAEARAFEQTQILQLDHGFNAGTFTARVVASTLAPVQSAVSAALGALYGPLHGGADQAAVEMARAIGHPSAVAAGLRAMQQRGEKVMGMGHREYRVVDPRSKIVEAIASTMARAGAGAEEFAVLQAVAQALAGEGDRVLHPNIEFYKGVVFLALGLAPSMFTSCFAIARVWGYIAHFAECRLHNRILRPAAQYIGAPERALPS